MDKLQFFKKRFTDINIYQKSHDHGASPHTMAINYYIYVSDDLSVILLYLITDKNKSYLINELRSDLPIPFSDYD